MTTRTQIADWLTAKLPNSIIVIPHPTMPDDPADNVTGLVIVVRKSIAPGPNLGRYIETHELWVLDPHTDRALSEDMLDQSLDAVLDAINDPDEHWMNFESAERDTFADEYPAYRITINIPTHTKE